MITINLLPVREERRKASARQFLMLALACVGASVALAAAHHWWYRGTVEEARQAAARVQGDIDRFGPQLAQVEAYRAVKAEIERKLQVIDDLSAARSGPVHLFDQIATHMPERMWLTKMSVEGQKIGIEGMSLDNELVALFLTSLNGSDYFQNVELVGTQAKEINGFKLNAFEVSASLAGPKSEAAPAAAPQAPASPKGTRAAAGAHGAAPGTGR